MAIQPPAAAKKNMIAKTHGSRSPLARRPIESKPMARMSGANGLTRGSSMKIASSARMGPATAPGTKYSVRMPAPRRS